MSRRFRFVFAGVLGAVLLAGITFGQSTFGSFTGTVEDPSGAVVPFARVEVVNEGTGATRQGMTSSAGVFNVVVRQKCIRWHHTMLHCVHNGDAGRRGARS
jgi:hypothetical protein